MTKPSILIGIHYLEIGGAEMALIGLLNAIDPQKADVDLFIYAHRGELMSLIPPHINILPEQSRYSLIEEPIATILKKRHFLLGLLRIIGKTRYNIHCLSHPNIKNGIDESEFQFLACYASKILPDINDKQYDLAINFCGINEVILKKVKARKKISWLHTDYSTVTLNDRLAMKVWSGFDHIASISDAVTHAFINKYPLLESKVIKIENILSSKFVRHRADQYDASSELSGSIKLLSIGRYCTAKNYDNVPDICRKLIESGVSDDLKWYIIGYGGDETLIRKKIADANMEKHVILLGKKDNPYPYIKSADIYVQPSRYEGKSITVREAQILCKPVVVTAYPTASSQIQDGVDGRIVPLDNEGCAKGLKRFITDKNQQNAIVSYLKNHDYGNESEVCKIYDLL